MPRRLRALGLVAALAAVSASASVAQATSVPPGMFSVGGWAWPTASDLSTGAAHGLTTWRVVLDYGAIGAGGAAVAHPLSFGGVDGLVADAARAGVTPMFVLTGCPAALCPVGGPPNTGAALAGWQAFVAATVGRYGAGGSFWSAHPELPRHPAVAWQVYNEVNGALQWPNPDPAAYAAFLATTAQTIRATDPSAKVVTAGLPEKMTFWMKDFLTGLYAQPAFRGAADVVAVHGYTADPAQVATILDTARKIMLLNGDGATPLWITEMGWATGGPPHPFTVSEAQQAANLRASWDQLTACRDRWNLQNVYWYSWGDKDPAGQFDYWGLHDGLVRVDGSPKPALSAFWEYTQPTALPAGRGADCTLPGGTTLDTTEPDTTIRSGPRPLTGDRLPRFRFASTKAQVTYACRMNGSRWTACTPNAQGVWRVDRRLNGGRHRFEVRAIDADGNIDETPAQRAFVVDTKPPDTRVKGKSGHVRSRRITLKLSATEPVRGFRCKIDRRPWRACARTFRATLAPGHHTIRVRAIDRVGLVDPHPAVRRYTVARR